MAINATSVSLQRKLPERPNRDQLNSISATSAVNLDVAIEVLPAVRTQDPERVARFEREAKVLAALNHPNIART